MILADLDSGQAYKGIGVNDFNFENIKISGNRREIEVNEIKVPIIEKDKLAYRKKALSLFDNLGNKDPDTVPRELHIWSGKLKKSAIDPEQQYIARNARFKLGVSGIVDLLRKELTDNNSDINGHQINIPDRLKNLREKSRNNKLFCPCGCGANLILVAGDKNLRE